MGDMRKDPTKRKTFGRKDGLTVKGKVKSQDTGRAFGGVKRKPKPIRPWGKGV